MKNNAKNKAKIGILFCGGCNCYYDREVFFKDLREKMAEECDFSFYKEAEPYDLVVMVNGCQSECLIGHEYSAPTLLINNKNYEQAEKLVRGKLENK